MNDRFYLTDGAHVFITGATGAGDEFGGKTVLLNWWVTRAVEQGHHDLGLIFNSKGHSFMRGKTVRTLQDLADAYRSGYRLFNFIPMNSEADHETVMQMLRELPGSKIVGHDEAHEYADSEMLDWMFRQGGNVEDSIRFETGNIRSLLTSQHPWDLPEAVTNNVPLFVYLGRKSPQAKRYFTTMQIAGAYEQMPDMDPYEWTVFNAGEFVEKNPPVPEEYAP
jgi:hypothetical protein